MIAMDTKNRERTDYNSNQSELVGVSDEVYDDHTN